MLAETLDKTPLRPLLLPYAQRFPFPLCGDEKWRALPQSAKQVLAAWGEEAAATPYPSLTATQFMAFVRDGSRAAYETPYFARRRKLIGAALAYCAAPAPALLDTVIDGIWCICEETFWGISAHNGSDHPGQLPAAARPLPDPDNPYIDLFAAQTACTLALISRLLEGALDAVTPLVRLRVRRELERRIFLPFTTRDDFWWMGMIRRDLNNWTPWIVSGVLHAAQAVIMDDAPLAQLTERGMRMLDRYLAVIPEDGGCDEGTAYWNMAGGSLLDCLEIISQLTGGRMTFWDDPKVRAIGAFPLCSHIAGGWYWNFADCDARPMLDGERLYAYGRYTDNPKLAALGASICDGFVPRDTPQMDRVLNKLFGAPSPAPAPAPQESVSLPQLQVFARMRGGLYAAIKGGHNGESHNHNDVGSFLLYVDGEPTIIDVGNMVYTAKTFGSERYTLWNTRGCSHNLPMIGDFEEREGREHCARDMCETQDAVSMDIAAAYPEEAGLVSLRRRFAFAPVMALTDEIVLRRMQRVTWVFMVRQAPQCVSDGLRVGGLHMAYDTSSLTLSVEKREVTDARMANNFPGAIWRITLTSPCVTSIAHTFTFTKEEHP